MFFVFICLDYYYSFSYKMPHLNNGEMSDIMQKNLFKGDKYCKILTSLGPEVMKLFLCSTQLSIKFQLLIKTKMLKKIGISCILGLI